MGCGLEKEATLGCLEQGMQDMMSDMPFLKAVSQNDQNVDYRGNFESPFDRNRQPFDYWNTGSTESQLEIISSRWRARRLQRAESITSGGASAWVRRVSMVLVRQGRVAAQLQEGGPP